MIARSNAGAESVPAKAVTVTCRKKAHSNGCHDAFFEVQLISGGENVQIGWSTEEAFQAMDSKKGKGVGDIKGSWGIVVGSRRLVFASGTVLPLESQKSSKPNDFVTSHARFEPDGTCMLRWYVNGTLQRTAKKALDLTGCGGLRGRMREEYADGVSIPAVCATSLSPWAR